MSIADEWARAHTIGHVRMAKEAERAKIAADVEAFLAAGGEITHVDGFTERRPRWNGRDIEDHARRGGKKAGRRVTA